MYKYISSGLLRLRKLLYLTFSLDIEQSYQDMTFQGKQIQNNKQAIRSCSAPFGLSLVNALVKLHNHR